jgi:hypothetical protein
MSTTGKDFFSVDWHLAGFFSTVRLSSDTEAAKAFSEQIFPSNIKYSCSIPADFISFINDWSEFKSNSQVIARDGLIPLLWFFKVNPKPTFFRGQILVQESLASIVPSSWAGHVGTYRLASDFVVKQKKPKKLLLMALIGDCFGSPDEFKKRLGKLKKRLAQLKNPDLIIECLFIDKTIKANGTAVTPNLGDCLITTARELSSYRVGMAKHVDLVSAGSFDDFWVHDLSGSDLNADSYLTQAVLQRGARLLFDAGPPKRGSKFKFVRLSPNHGFVVNSDLLPKGDREKILSLTKRVFLSPANTSLPWRHWVKPAGPFRP